VRAARREPPDKLEQVEVAGRDQVVAALAVEAEHLDRPPPDAGDRAQAPPGALVVGSAQVSAPGRDLVRGAAQRDRPPRGQVVALQQGGRGARDPRRRGEVAQARRRAPPAEAEHDAPLDRDGAREVDELLGDRPRERLERVGAAADPQPRPGAHGHADQRVAPEAVVEGPQVVVDPEGEAHAVDRLDGGVPVRGARAEQDLVAAGLRDAHDDRFVADVDEALEDAAATAQDAVRRPAGKAERPSRAHGLPDLGHAGGLYARGPTAAAAEPARCGIGAPRAAAAPDARYRSAAGTVGRTANRACG